MRGMQQRRQAGHKGHASAHAHQAHGHPDQPPHVSAQQRLQQRDGADQQVRQRRQEQAQRHHRQPPDVVTQQPAAAAGIAWWNPDLIAFWPSTWSQPRQQSARYLSHMQGASAQCIR